MDKEGGNKEKMRKCEKMSGYLPISSFSLHFLIIFSFLLHFFAAPLPSATSCATLYRCETIFLLYPVAQQNKIYF